MLWETPSLQKKVTRPMNIVEQVQKVTYGTALASHDLGSI